MQNNESNPRTAIARRYHQKKVREGYKHFLLSPMEANVIKQMREASKKDKQ
jgi:hypothetical protein